MNINQSIQKHTGIWVLLTFLTTYILTDIFVNALVINRTIGWHLDIINQLWISYVFTYSPVIYMLLYTSIFSLQRKETNLLISKIHLILIAICEFLYHFVEFDMTILLFFSAVSILTFFINIYVSLSNQKDKD